MLLHRQIASIEGRLLELSSGWCHRATQLNLYATSGIVAHHCRGIAHARVPRGSYPLRLIVLGELDVVRRRRRVLQCLQSQPSQGTFTTELPEPVICVQHG